MEGLKPLLSKEPDNFKVELFVAEQNTYLLVIKVTGDYPSGSLGVKQAHWLKLMTAQASFGFEPYGIILDFSDLSYQWGDGLFQAVQVIDAYANSDDDGLRENFQLVFVVGEQSKHGIKSLLGEKASLFDDLDKAIKFVDTKVTAWLEEI